MEDVLRELAASKTGSEATTAGVGVDIELKRFEDLSEVLCSASGEIDLSDRSGEDGVEEFE